MDIEQAVITIMQNVGKISYNSEDFKKEFIKHESCFENWRYWHESRSGKGILECNINFIIALKGILKAIAQNKYGERPIKNNHHY